MQRILNSGPRLCLPTQNLIQKGKVTMRDMMARKSAAMELEVTVVVVMITMLLLLRKPRLVVMMEPRTEIYRAVNSGHYSSFLFSSYGHENYFNGDARRFTPRDMTCA